MARQRIIAHLYAYQHRFLNELSRELNVSKSELVRRALALDEFVQALATRLDIVPEQINDEVQHFINQTFPAPESWEMSRFNAFVDVDWARAFDAWDAVSAESAPTKAGILRNSLDYLIYSRAARTWHRRKFQNVLW